MVSYIATPRNFERNRQKKYFYSEVYVLVNAYEKQKKNHINENQQISEISSDNNNR